MSGEQSINDDGCADQRQRHEREPNFWAGEVLCGNGTDLRADGRAGVHHERDQNVYIAFYRVAERSITG